MEAKAGQIQAWEHSNLAITLKDSCAYTGPCGVGGRSLT
jgi:hypothetical protein